MHFARMILKLELQWQKQFISNSRWPSDQIVCLIHCGTCVQHWPSDHIACFIQWDMCSILAQWSYHVFYTVGHMFNTSLVIRLPSHTLWDMSSILWDAGYFFFLCWLISSLLHVWCSFLTTSHTTCIVS